MKAEIILTDNNINIDLNEPTIDVSTEDGFSVTIIGGVGPQGNRGPEGPKGEKGDDYVLTEEDKDDIAGMAAEKVAVPVRDVQIDDASILSDGIANIPVAEKESQVGLLRIHNRGLIFYPDPFDNTKKVLAINAASASAIKGGQSYWDPLIPQRQHMSVFYGLAKAAGVDMASSSNPVGTYTDEAKTAIRAMLDVPPTEDIPSVPVEDVRISGVSIVKDGIADLPIAIEVPGVVRIGATAYGLTIVNNPNHQDYGIVKLFPANDTDIKSGTRASRAIDPAHQHQAVFYGLAKAAGDDTQKESENAVGTYTEAAKTAIRGMLDAVGSEDYATSAKAGVIKVNPTYGTDVTGGGSILTLAPATLSGIKNGTSSARPITPQNQHQAVFYGLAKIAGQDEKNSELTVGQYTEAAKIAIRAMLGALGVEDIPAIPVQDVQINRSSILDNGVANIPIATDAVPGAARFHADYGLAINGSNPVRIISASSARIKAGAHEYTPIVPYRQHESTFYGLAKAAGDVTQSQSSNAVGTYTEEAKTAIRTMLGLDDQSIVDIVQLGLPAAEEVAW